MGFIYGVLIFVNSVFFFEKDVFVVYEMNGVLIFRDYGFFVWFVVLGIVGVCNVKWFKKIILSKEESFSYW